MRRAADPRARSAADTTDIRPAPAVAMSMADHTALFRLMTWLSPAFPIGAFAYSSGLEWAIEAGNITDAPSLQNWLATLLQEGQGFNDGVCLAETARAIVRNDDALLATVAELAAALAPTRERHLEATTQGEAFMAIAQATWDCPALHCLRAVYRGPVTYPVAVGTLSAGHNAPLDLTMHAFLHAQTVNWISAGSRLIPLGQTDSQRVLANLEDVIVKTATRALQASLDDLGSATFRADIASMRHETQYTRLFRS
jgi:urease accessory protein